MPKTLRSAREDALNPAEVEQLLLLGMPACLAEAAGGIEGLIIDCGTSR